MVTRVKRLVLEGRIDEGSEVFVVTNNAVSESIFYKGSAKVSMLHDLVVELRKIELEKKLIIHVIWCSGKRMIQIGVDGLSRGDIASGVMKGDDLLTYLPFNESAIKRYPALLAEIGFWSQKTRKFDLTCPVDWFDTVFNHKDSNGSFDAHTKFSVWAPSPCTAQVAVEQLCEAKHLFTATSHIFLCPAVMTAYWRKMLGKIADSMFTIKSGTCLWPTDMFEPLTIAFIKPLLSSRPFKVGRLPSVVEWESNVREVQFKDKATVRRHMRKFWAS